MVIGRGRGNADAVVVDSALDAAAAGKLFQIADLFPLSCPSARPPVQRAERDHNGARPRVDDDDDDDDRNENRDCVADGPFRRWTCERTEKSQARSRPLSLDQFC